MHIFTCRTNDSNKEFTNFQSQAFSSHMLTQPQCLGNNLILMNTLDIESEASLITHSPDASKYFKC